MTSEFFDAQMPIEVAGFAVSPSATGLPEAATGPTLEAAMAQAAKGTSDGPLQKADLSQNEEALDLDLWLNPRFQTARSVGVDDIAALTPLLRSDDAVSLSIPTMAASNFEQPNNIDEHPNLDYVDSQLRSWYDWSDPGDELSEKLEEWGRQVSDWVWSIVPGSPGPNIIVTGPDGLDVGNNQRIVFHQDGSGLISLFDGNTFVTGLEAATPQTATLVFTVTGYNYEASITTPYGSVQGSVGGGPSTSLYFRPRR